MLIIIEGSDRTGKTTLANLLNRFLNIPIVAFSSKKGFTYMKLKKFIFNQKTPIICSRFHISEMVYGCLLRGKPSINYNDFIHLNKLINSKGGFLIYCYTNSEELRRRFIKDNETSVPLELIPEILQLFSRYVNLAQKYLPVITFEIENYLNKSNEIKKMIELYKERLNFE